MSYAQKTEQERVNREQQYAKEKARDVINTAKDIKEGKKISDRLHVDVENLPSNEKLTASLQRGEESIDRFQTSDRGQQMGEPAQKVVEDIKQVLSDEQTLLAQKNAGNLLQNVVAHFWALLQDLRRDPTLREIFEEWQGNFTGLMSSGDFTQFLQQAGELFTSLKDTEEFLELLSQLIDVLKLTIAEKTEQITEGETFDLTLHKQQKDRDRQQIVDQIRATMTSLSDNNVWGMFVHKGKLIGHKAKTAGEISTESAKEVAYRVKDSKNFQLLVQDFRDLLQRLVGPKRDVGLFFDYSKNALNDILSDDELSYLVDELHILLNKIVADPALLDDESMQERISSLAGRADAALERFKTDPNILGAKEESRELWAALKNDPANAQFIDDVKTLWHDVISDKPGEIIEHDVMTSIRQMIIPLFLEHLNNVPLPAVNGTGHFLGKFDYSIDNMKISLPELIPENIHLRFEMNLDAHPLELAAETKKTYLYLQASNIQLHLHDANWTYQRLAAPKLHDSGIFDVDTTGNGMTIWMKMEVKGEVKSGTGDGGDGGHAHTALTVLKSDVKIHQNFHISFHDSHHDKLYAMLTHIFAHKIKKNIIELLQEKLKLFGDYFSDQLMALIDQARVKSLDFAKLAADQKEKARHGIENLKLQAQERINDVKENPDVQESKQEAKSTAKILLGAASERVQTKLDEQKLKLEQQKEEKIVERMMAETEQSPIYQSQPQTTTPTMPITKPTQPPTIPHKPAQSQ